MEQAVLVAVTQGGLAKAAGQKLAIPEGDEAIAGAHVAAPLRVIFLLNSLQVHQHPACNQVGKAVADGSSALW